MANVIPVYVYKDEGFIDLADSYKVYPPIVVLHKGDEFQIVNTTDETASWLAPGELEEAGQQGPNQKEEIKAKQKSKKWKVKKEELLVIEYEVKVGGHKAHGNSDPRIIIDP